MAKIWGIQPWVGKNIEEDKTVMDQYNAEAKPENKAKAQAESQALEGTSFILDDYIGPGAFAKIGATIKAAGSALAGKAMLVGAFRSSNDSMLSRKMVERLKAGFPPIEPERLKVAVDNNYLDTMISSKISERELAKYGTPEFLLDKWLSSTRSQYPDYPVAQAIKIKTANDLDRTFEANTIKAASEEKADAIRSLAIDRGDGGRAIDESAIATADRMILRQASLVEDFAKAQKEGKTLIHDRLPRSAETDIWQGIDRLENSMLGHNITAADVEGKSLQQITALVHKKDEESVRILRKSIDARNKIIQAKTAQLAESAPQPVEGFVQLQEPIDLAHETCALNHCLGAVGRDNDVYTPAFDVVTGKAHPNEALRGTSYSGYVERMADGRSEFYSYRPKGTPEFTIEVVNNDKGRYITQAYGKEDRVLTDAEENLVKEWADKSGVDYPDWKGHYVNDEFDQLLQQGDAWAAQLEQAAVAPDNAIGQNANDVYFWNFLQDQ